MREPQSEVDNVYFIVEATAATVGTQRAEDVVSDEDLVETSGETSNGWYQGGMVRLGSVG
jgi:hypothetical protein